MIWCFTNCHIGGGSIFAHCAALLDTPAQFIGLDGVILLGFLLGFPAMKLSCPLSAMGYTAGNALAEITDLSRIHEIPDGKQLTAATALCMLLFLLFSFSCSTTLLTIHKENRQLEVDTGGVGDSHRCGNPAVRRSALDGSTSGLYL